MVNSPHKDDQDLSEFVFAARRDGQGPLKSLPDHPEFWQQPAIAQLTEEVKARLPGDATQADQDAEARACASWLEEKMTRGPQVPCLLHEPFGPVRVPKSTKKGLVPLPLLQPESCSLQDQIVVAPEPNEGSAERKPLRTGIFASLDSDDSLEDLGPESVVTKLKTLESAPDPVPELQKLCRTYQLLELEGAPPDLLCKGIASLAARLADESAAVRGVYKEALLLTVQAMQVREEAVLDILQACLQLDKLGVQEVAGMTSFHTAASAVACAADLETYRLCCSSVLW